MPWSPIKQTKFFVEDYDCAIRTWVSQRFCSIFVPASLQCVSRVTEAIQVVISTRCDF